MPDAIPDHAEHRRDQCPDILQRCEYREQQHRARLDHDIPAEHQRFHLERPGGEQIGRPLKAIVADLEWRERGSAFGSAQDAMTRFTAFPAFFLDFFGKASQLSSVALTMPLSIRTAACGHARRHLPATCCTAARVRKCSFHAVGSGVGPYGTECKLLRGGKLSPHPSSGG